MNLEKIKTELKQSVAFDLKQSLITLGKYIDTSSPKFDDYILLLGRFNQCVSEYSKNVISKTERDLIFDKTRDLLLQFVDEITVENLIFIESKKSQEEEITTLQKKLDECEIEIKKLKTLLDNLVSCQFRVSFVGVEVIENEDLDSKNDYPLIVRELYETDLKYPEKIFLIELNVNYPENILLNRYFEKDSKLIFTREYFSVQSGFFFRRLIFLKNDGNYSNLINFSVNISQYCTLEEWSKTATIDEFRRGDSEPSTFIDTLRFYDELKKET